MQFVPSILRTYTLPQANISFGANVITQIVQANPRRIALGIYASDGDVRIFPTSSGVILSNIKPYLASAGGYWYMASEVGPLTQVDWYCFSINSGSVTVLEVVEET